MKIEIEVVGKGKTTAEFDDRNPETSQKIYETLPIEGSANLYLEEVYFDIPLEMEYENPSDSAEKGDLSYWPPGNAFCIFYGESQPASDVNHIGKIINNLDLFFNVEDSDKLIIKTLDEGKE